MDSYPQPVVERAMKVQEVILRAMVKKITWWQAAEIIAISDRQMRRWRERYEEHGCDGLFDRRKGEPGAKRVPVEMAESVLGLYQEKYYDFNVRHFHEELKEQHGIGLSYTWVKEALQGAGLVKKAARRGVHRRRRPRRPLAGTLLHLDGSRHQCFQDEWWHDLLVILDDATRSLRRAEADRTTWRHRSVPFRVVVGLRLRAFRSNVGQLCAKSCAPLAAWRYAGRRRGARCLSQPKKNC
jgi:transposase